MVYLTPALAAGVALSVLTSSVSGLPAAQAGAAPSTPSATPTHNTLAMPRRSPLADPFARMQTKRGSYVGGGSGSKRLRQAPLMKPARLAKVKRTLFARDTDHDHEHEHIHIHEHDHDHDGHRHRHDDYDPNHSEHWNEHHGRIDDDHHQNHHSRSLIDIQALNLGSLNRNQKFQKCSGWHYHCTNGREHGKRALDKVTAPVKKLLSGGSKSKGKGATKTKSSASQRVGSGSGKHGHGLLKSFRSKGGRKHRSDRHGKGKREVEEEEPMQLEARDHRDHEGHRWHGGHYYGDGHDHEHEHEHVHVHKHEHNHKRSASPDHHQDHSDHWYEHHGIDRHHHHEHVHDHEHYHGHEHIHSHVHDRRQLAPAGVPGFVQVASTLSHSTLAKSVAGLVFSKDPDTNSSDFVLGTSDSQSTQFYLAPYTDPSVASGPPVSSFAVDPTTGQNGTDIDPEVAAATYQLRIPILDSSSQQANDYCATFDIKPPSPLSMQPCGQLDGYSQIFGYNSTTGELSPIYPPSSTQPKPLNAAVKIGNPQILAAQVGQGAGDGSGNAGPVSASASGSGSGTGTDPVSAWNDAAAATSSSFAGPSSTVASSSPAPLPAASAPVTPPKVSLYFIPSSAYYSDPDSIESLGSAANSTVTEATSTVSDPAAPIFTPAPAAIKAVYDDGSDYYDDEDAVYTTVTITTTISAEPAGPTGDSSSYQTFDSTQSGRNNAVIADSPDNFGDDSSYAQDPSAVDGADADAGF